MKVVYLAVLAAMTTTCANADSVWYCHNGDCAGRTVAPAAPYGTYSNPVQDELGGDLSVPVHRGMYCANGTWHTGWLRPWERSPVIKPSCGSAVYQISQ